MKTFQTYVFEKLKLNSNTKLKTKKQYFPKTKNELEEYCSLIINNTPEGQTCDLNIIDTSEITDMNYLFLKIKRNLNNKEIEKIDVSDWDVSNVTDMSNMFSFCYKLTDIGNLKNWNVKKVSNMGQMFSNCSSLQKIE